MDHATRMLQSEVLQALARRYLSPDTRALVRSRVLRARSLAEASKLWNWELSRATDGHFDVLYAGRARERWRAARLLPAMTEHRFSARMLSPERVGRRWL